MPEPLDHIAFLSQEIGPRPAGTEEEQQAALYITEQLQKEAGLSAMIEDFNSESNEELPKALCAIATFIFTLLAIFLPVMAIPSLLVAAIAGVLYAMEFLGRPILSKMFARGVSQNVVAKYEPVYSAEAGGSRRRKIILVANYDSGKVKAELKGPFIKALPLLQKIVLGAMGFIPAFLLIRYLFFLHAEGVTATILNAITIIALVIIAIPIILFIMHRVAPYNEAANCNASGIAVLLDIAARIGRRRTSGTDLEERLAVDDVTIHGEDEARAAGLVPEGAKLVYEAAQMNAPQPAPQSEEERLFAAKAAIAALTGKPVSSQGYSSIAGNLVQVREGFPESFDDDEVKEFRDETREALQSIPPETLEEAREKAALGASLENEAAQIEGSAEALPSDQVAEDEDSVAAQETAEHHLTSDYGQPAVPDWFKKAQENAKRSSDAKPANIQRSKYADALDAAVAESTSHFYQANKVVSMETEERLRKMRDGIMEVSAPQYARESLEAQRNAAEGNAQDGGQQENLRQGDDLGSTTALPPIDVNELSASIAQAQTGSFAEENVGETIPQSKVLGAEDAASLDAEQRRPIVLPDIGVSAANLTPIDTSKQQRAPLAQAEEESTQVAAKSLLNMLPSIDLGGAEANDEALNNESLPDAAVLEESRPNLKSSLPSLSGEIKTEEKTSDGAEATGSVSAAGSFTSVGATGTFTPVGDELLQDVHPDDIYVEDADDSVYDGSLTETGAFAGPGYVEMPKSRVRRFFDRFGSKKDKEKDSISANEWLDVDDDFEAQSVGKARGGWESFQEDRYEEDSYEEEYTENIPRRKTSRDDKLDDEWEGGAFSRRGEELDIDEGFEEVDFPTAPQAAFDPSRSGEIQQIHQFRNSDINTEIWFVALGSQLANNGGMKAFLSEHEQDLRGSIVINLEALAAGELCYLEHEGFKKKSGASSRMKRYVQKASQASRVHIDPATLRWRESAATVSINQGIQAVSIVGMEDGKPSHFAQGDDVLENINDEVLRANTAFVMELIRNI